MAENINKQAPKGKIKFSITLSEEQKLAKTNILYHPYNFIMGKAGSGKTLLAVQIALDMFFNRKINQIIIKRPTVSWVMSLILIVFGLFVFWKLPVRELPNGIQPPVVQVQVDYKSAAASIVDQEVTQVVEDVIGGAEGIKYIDSKSGVFEILMPNL